MTPVNSNGLPMRYRRMNVMTIQTVAEETSSNSAAAKRSNDNVSRLVATLQSKMSHFKVQESVGLRINLVNCSCIA